MPYASNLAPCQPALPHNHLSVRWVSLFKTKVAAGWETGAVHAMIKIGNEPRDMLHRAANRR